MKNKIDQLIGSKFEDREIAPRSTDMWERIEANLNKTETKKKAAVIPLFMKYAVAACMLGIAAVAGFYLTLEEGAIKSAPTLVQNTNSESIKEDNSSTFVEEETRAVGNETSLANTDVTEEISNSKLGEVPTVSTLQVSTSQNTKSIKTSKKDRKKIAEILQKEEEQTIANLDVNAKDIATTEAITTPTTPLQKPSPLALSDLGALSVNISKPKKLNVKKIAFTNVGIAFETRRDSSSLDLSRSTLSKALASASHMLSNRNYTN